MFGVIGELHPEHVLGIDKYLLLSQVARWLKYSRDSAYNEACSPKGHYEARNRLKAAAVQPSPKGEKP